MSDGQSLENVEETTYEVQTEKCGKLDVYVQGDLGALEKKAVFLTVHDMGSNHKSFHPFVEHGAMSEIRQRSVFVHVDVPGQEDGAPDLPVDYQFPTMQILAEDLVCVLDHLRIKYVVCLGEGAGANILSRFAMAHPSRCLGLILIHCTATTAGVMEYFKDKIINWKLQNVGMNPTAEQYLIFHKFGATLEEQLEKAENKEKLIQDFADKLKTRINPRNLRFYVEAFLNRSDLSGQLEKNLTVDTLLVTGARGSHVQNMETMKSHMNKQKSSLIKFDDCGDVMAEAPDKLAKSLLLFVKGIGLLTSLTMPGVERTRSYSGEGKTRRSISMEEADRPRRLSSVSSDK